MTKPSPSDQLSALSDRARYVVFPDNITATEWPKVSRWARKLQVVFDPWQTELGQLLLALDGTGHYASTIGLNVISICRQAGKTYLIGWIVFCLALAHPGTTWVWTAHQLRTSNEVFRSMLAMSKTESIAPYMTRPNLAAGNQAINFVNGSRILFGARERGFGRGIPNVTGLIFDEAQILTLRAFDDMLPSTNTAHNPFIVLLGTPPKPSDPSEVFAFQRSQALRGELRNGLYVEFSADQDANPDDPAQRAKANPSYPHRTKDIAIQRLRQNMPNLASFRREALGIWDEKAAAQQTIPATAWTKRKTATPPTDGITSYGIKFTPLGDVVALAVALKPADGLIHVEALDYKPVDIGLEWLVTWLAARADKAAQIVIDGKAGAGMLAVQLAEAGVKSRVIILPTTEQVVTAHAMMLNAVASGIMTHFGQPALNDDVTHAGKRLIGNRGGWGWTPINGASDVALLDAVTLAHWAAKTSKRRPGRRQYSNI